MNQRLRSFASLAFLSTCLAGAVACTEDANPPATPSSSTPAPSPGIDPAPSETPKQNAGGTGETKSVKVDNATGGTIALSDGTELEVPPGALPPGVDTITVTSQPAPAPAEYVAASPVFVFGPDGTVFLKPLKISLPLTLPAGKSVSDMTILWSRAHGDGFDMIPSEITAVSGSTTSFIATGSVTHFSEGFCGVKYETDPHPSTDPYAK